MVAQDAFPVEAEAQLHDRAIEARQDKQNGPHQVVDPVQSRPADDADDVLLRSFIEFA